MEIGSIKKLLYALKLNPNFDKNEIKNIVIVLLISKESIQAGQLFLQWEKCGI